MSGIVHARRAIDFEGTNLQRTFQEQPLGFIDIGSAGGIHPLVQPAASFVHALCFEVDAAACRDLEQAYKKNSSYAKVTVCQAALAAERGQGKTLYVSKTASNTSLLEPHSGFVRRYAAEKFAVERTLSVPTQTLDAILESEELSAGRLGEFIKLDTQGTEYDILKGAGRVLEDHCVAVWTEVEFFEVYAGQKTFSDIDCLLREHGMLIYGLYPHYRSTKKLDRRRFATEERLMWADALFFKDPLDTRNQGRAFSPRQIQALILVAVLTGYFDFALELIKRFNPDLKDAEATERLILKLAEVDQKEISAEVSQLHRACSSRPDESYFHAGLFAGRHHSNTSLDHLSS